MEKEQQLVAAPEGQKRPSHIRDLVLKIWDVCAEHIALSQVTDIIAISLDHMVARARIEEVNRDVNGGLIALDPAYRLTKRTILRSIYNEARKFPNYHYATLGVDEVRIVTTDQKNFKVRISEE